MSCAPFQIKMLHILEESIEAIYQNLFAVISPKQQLHFQKFTTGLTLVIQMKSLSICHRNEHILKETHRNKTALFSGRVSKISRDYLMMINLSQEKSKGPQLYDKISP